MKTTQNWTIFCHAKVCLRLTIRKQHANNNARARTQNTMPRITNALFLSSTIILETKSASSTLGENKVKLYKLIDSFLRSRR